ncbi:hypothetical protein KKF38_00240 [Patescibacteria group bacterium]|nr:hypothetical protein [Patescibacteria group bacterium]
MLDENENTLDINGKLLRLIAIVNVLTLLLLTVFFAMSWNVITADDDGQLAELEQAVAELDLKIEKMKSEDDSAREILEKTTEKEADQNVVQKEPIQTEQLTRREIPVPLPTDKPQLDSSEKECMDECIQGGEMPPKCAEECGIELPPREDENNAQGKCGDGVCDEVEQNNPEVCPEDC